MNTNPHCIKILCYGDSNTWGRIPGVQGGRYPENVRWTGLLQGFLGEKYGIIEEGLGGRTTVVDDPEKIHRNGKEYIIPCLLTHNPINIVILFLGTNDLKKRLNRKPQQIVSGVSQLIQIIKKFGHNKREESPTIILVSPPVVDESVSTVKENYLGAEKKSSVLAPLYKKIAEKHECEFIDSALYVKSSKVDGYHLDPGSHQILAQLLNKRIKSLKLKQ